MSPVLEFEGIARSYKKGVPVLDGVTFSVEPGEVVGLLGRDDPGKTALIRIAVGILHPQAGSVRVFGLSPVEDPVEAKKRIGYAAEDRTLPGHSSIAEMTAFHRYLFPSWDAAWERRLLERFNLDPAARREFLEASTPPVSGAFPSRARKQAVYTVQCSDESPYPVLPPRCCSCSACRLASDCLCTPLLAVRSGSVAGGEARHHPVTGGG